MKLTIGELRQAIASASVLRSYPQFKLEVANEINGLVFKLKPFLKEREADAEVLAEREDAALKIENDNEKIVAIRVCQKENNDFAKAVVDVVINPLSIDRFVGVEITGDKEVPQNSGMSLKFSYRDAYFELMNLGLIV